MCSILDGCSRAIVHWEIREKMQEIAVETIVQRGREKYTDARPRVITDNGPQFISRGFKEFISIAGITHLKTSLKRISGQIKKDWRAGFVSRDQLKSQLVAFRDSCDLLIDGPLVGTLKGLPETSVNDVRDRCRSQKKLASELIANLDSGKPTSVASSAADAMIEKLTNKLNEIASSA